MSLPTVQIVQVAPSNVSFTHEIYLGFWARVKALIFGKVSARVEVTSRMPSITKVSGTMPDGRPFIVCMNWETSTAEFHTVGAFGAHDEDIYDA
jgi:hypothetical protein